MASNNHLDEKQPKTPHEEIMFCIESTNDIVSKILTIHEEQKERRLRLIAAFRETTAALEAIRKE